MTKDMFDALEVKPRESGCYYVTLCCFKDEESLTYIKVPLVFEGGSWFYRDYPLCYVCFIHKVI